MPPLFIIGYMGCGKTTFGRALAQATGLRFIDLDDYIEDRYRHTVRELFDHHGQDGFRDMERRMLHEVADFEDCIVSCGGGTPCFFDNMEYMNSHGTTLWLKASEPTLFTRLIRKREKRPLLAGRTDEEIRGIITAQLAERTPFYSRAQKTWQCDTLEDRRQIDANIRDFLDSGII